MLLDACLASVRSLGYNYILSIIAIVSYDPHKTALLDKSFFSMALKVYNKIQNQIANTTELHIFKNELRSWLTDKALLYDSSFFYC